MSQLFLILYTYDIIDFTEFQIKQLEKETTVEDFSYENMEDSVEVSNLNFADTNVINNGDSKNNITIVTVVIKSSDEDAVLKSNTG